MIGKVNVPPLVICQVSDVEAPHVTQLESCHVGGQIKGEYDKLNWCMKSREYMSTHLLSTIEEIKSSFAYESVVFNYQGKYTSLRTLTG